MSLGVFPEGFDPRSEVLVVLELVNISTPDGDFGFMMNVDGVFRDVNGKEWWGSTLFQSGDLDMSINGSAPAGSLSMSFFEDPDQGDLVKEIKQLGAEYVSGRPLTFYKQALRSLDELSNPEFPPIPFLQRKMVGISASVLGPYQRSLSVSFEGPFSGRNSASGLCLTTEDHSALIGEQNSSLRFMPRDSYQEEKLFG